MKKNFPIKNKNGFALLFTVLVVSLILSIAMGISNITFKQGILSNLAKDSQISFYKADAAVECAMYYDLNKNAFPKDTAPVATNISCGNSTFSEDVANSSTNYLIFSDTVNTAIPCASFSVDKTGATTIIKARGYNVCTSSPRKVERALQVTY